MHFHRTLRTLWLLPVVLAGCSTTMGSRFGGTPQSKSIAVVGERPLPSSTGEPGGRVVAESEEPEPRRNPKTRISGRVVDEMGEPIPGAVVRLADGGSKGGKEIRGISDRSGAFTLNGLRPGSNYVLIAEAEDDHGPLVGRVEARTAETGVEIGLAAEEKKSTTARRSAKPSRAKPISNREASDEASDAEETPRLNREDVAPPAEEADPIDPGPPEPTRAGRPKLSPIEPGVGWRNSKNSTAARPRDTDADEETTSPDRPAPRRKVDKDAESADADEDTNPLPPALDPGTGSNPDDVPAARPASARAIKLKKVGAKVTPKPRESGSISLAPDVSLDSKADHAKSPAKEVADPALAGDFRPLSTLMPEDPAEPASAGKSASKVAPVVASADEPPTIPPVGAPSVAVAVAASEPPGPTGSPPASPAVPQNPTPSNPAPQPVFASQGPATNPPPADDYNPFAHVAPVASEPDRVADRTEPTPAPSPETRMSPIDEAPKKKWGELASAERPSAVVEPTRATVPTPLGRRRRANLEDKTPSIALCSYDTRQRKIVDFTLPDLEGKPVRFQDLDADYVLIDFWGTWCPPCLDSIPHLISLQKKYGPDKLKVVGIACEEVPPEQRKAKVDEVSRKLGINYPVLLSTMDGKPCPVQQALQIQAMPTMILVDRKGQVLWRNAGSTPASENRLDRVLALSMSRADTIRR